MSVSAAPALDVAAVRAQFPALTGSAADPAPVFFDNPGGTQVPHPVVAAMTDYLVNANANTGGAFATSERSDAALAAARQALADFLNAPAPHQVVFGANMTGLTFAVSRAFGRLLQPGDEIVTTVLDHDANVAPWLELATERGAVIRTVDIRTPDCTLDMDQLAALLSPKTKLLAIGLASNATGTVNDVAAATRLAQAAGARVYVDAVQFAPHRAIDVQALGCDFLVCSAYKFFGPHVGVLYGTEEALDALPAIKVRPASDHLPWRLETGTVNHEGIVGAGAAVDYLADLGRRTAALAPATPRRAAIVAAMDAIAAHEAALFDHLLNGIEALPGARVWGITDRVRFADRGPTACFTWDRLSARETAAHLGRHGVNAWDGDYYAMALMQRLGLAPGGAVRLGLAHYNTTDEVDRVVALLGEAS